MLKKLMIRFFVGLIIISATIISIQAIINIYKPSLISSAILWIIVLFLLISSTIHYFLLKTTQNNIRKFITVFLGTITFKLIIYLFFMIIYAFSNRENAKIFLLNFIILYIIYTVYEVIMILKQLKLIDKKL